MATPFHNNVGLASIKNEDFNRTFLYSGNLTQADAERGAAVTLDTTAPNTVKLTGEGDTVIGRLETIDTGGRKTCAVQLRFSEWMPVKSGVTLVAGDTVIGAANGEVKKATANDLNINYVVEVKTGFAVVVKL